MLGIKTSKWITLSQEFLYKRNREWKKTLACPKHEAHPCLENFVSQILTLIATPLKDRNGVTECDQWMMQKCVILRGTATNCHLAHFTIFS